jgi:hypothetical protein
MRGHHSHGDRRRDALATAGVPLVVARVRAP